MPIVYRAGLSDSEINTVEFSLNTTLPDSYRKLLKQMNGFYLSEPDCGQLQLPAIDDGVISFDRLFGVIPDEECNDLVSFNSEFIDELSFIDGVVAIGEDGGGNPYVLIIEEGREGVYYWDRTHLHEGDSINNYDIAEQNECGHLYFVVKTVDELYAALMSSLGGSASMIEEV